MIAKRARLTHKTDVNTLRTLQTISTTLHIAHTHVPLNTLWTLLQNTSTNTKAALLQNTTQAEPLIRILEDHTDLGTFDELNQFWTPENPPLTGWKRHDLDVFKTLLKTQDITISDVEATTALRGFAQELNTWPDITPQSARERDILLWTECLDTL